MKNILRPSGGVIIDLVPRLDPHTATVIGQFVKDRFEEARADKAVLGLSGGLDSALVLKVLSDNLGKEKVRALFLPYGGPNGEDREFAALAASWMDVEMQTVDISPIVDQVPMKLDDRSKGNIMARTRMMVLYAVANSENGIVVGTSNKSELLTGYFTKYGDGGADIFPIGDLYKTQVRELSSKLGVPKEIIGRPPSAGLILGQTDENDLGIPYPLLDQVLFGHVRGFDAEAIAEMLYHGSTTPEEAKRSGIELPMKVQDIIRIIGMVKRARHKRMALAVPKLEVGTVGLDLRERW